ncbi:MAG: hypothetical protein AB1813_03385 [Verrucomicrobiota bacterium]|jgi:hypothetical protein
MSEEIKSLTVSPRKGIMPVLLGMTLQEVTAALNVTPQGKCYINGGERWNFSLNPTQSVFVSFRDAKAVEIEASPGPVPVLFNGVELFKPGGEQEAWNALLNAQPDPRSAGYGTVIFDRLGIAAGYYLEEELGDRSLVIFAEGVWPDVSQLPFARVE